MTTSRNMDQVASDPIAGSITANPNPLAAATDSSTTLHWETNARTAEVCVSDDGAQEKLVSRGTSGSLDVEWIRAGRYYVFRLYSLAEARALLGEVTVFRKVFGRINVKPNPNPFSTDGKTVLEWEITRPAIAEVCLSEDGGAERIVSRGESGSFEVTGLQAGIKYTFLLYTRMEPRQLLDQANLLYDIVGRISATPNPVPVEAGSKTLLEWEVPPPASAEVCVSEDGLTERLVCRGASGTYEVTGLRSGIDYRFRLYASSQSRPLLDEIKVRLSDIPWESLLDRLDSASGGKGYSSQLAEFIARVLPRCIRHAEFSNWFRLWEENGVHVTPVHFYESIPDLRSLDEKLWDQLQELSGIEMNETMQLHLLCDVFPAFKEEYQQIPIEAATDGNTFYLKNGRFEGIDSMLAYCVIRHFKPQQIIEVGSGYSTLILAQAARANGDTQLHSIEPYPEDFLRSGVAGLTSLLAKKVEEVDLSFFACLEPGDCLFIDTSHVIRIGGDVNYLFLQVLPRLKPGVIVHVHDIFLPREYPREWVVERRRFWTEQYLLQAFLTYNSEFEVLVSSGYLKAYHPEGLKAVFPTCPPWQGGSFWMRRKPAPARDT